MNNDTAPRKVTKSGLIVIAIGATLLCAAILFSEYKFNPYSSGSRLSELLILFVGGLVFLTAIIYISLKISPKDMPLLKKESDLMKVDGTRDIWILILLVAAFVIAAVVSIYEGIKNAQSYSTAFGVIMIAFGALLGWAFYNIYKISKHNQGG